MARNKLRFDIDAKDRTKQAFGRIRRSLNGLRKSVFSVKGALIGLGAGMVGKSFIKTAMDIENLQLRFKFLFKTTKEGNKAFAELTKFAAKVPFSLEQIAQGSGNLAVVTKDADELAKMLEITGNVAAVTGLDFRTTAEQIQRSFGAGIGAADLFRDRGVRALMGFKAGAKVTIEETKARFFELFGKGGAFGDAANEMANTFTGTLSMLGDKWFKFQMETVESAFFSKLKQRFGNLNDFLDTHQKKVTEIATAFGKKLATGVEIAGQSVIFLFENFSKLVFLIKTFIAFKLIIFFGEIAIAIGAMTKAVWMANTAMIALNATTKRNLLFMTAGTIAAGIAYLTSKLGEFREENRKLTQDLEDGPEIFSKERLAEIQAEWDKEEAEKAIKRKKEKDEELIRLEIEKFKRLYKINKEQHARDKERDDAGRRLLKKNQEDTLAILSTTSQRAFKAFKAWKISEAIIDAIGSFNKALNSGYPPPLNFALAASSLALGFAKVSAIRSQTYSGRADGGPVSAEKAYRIGERGPEMFVPGQSGYILPNQDGRTVNVSFNINAVDTRGFQQLLANERGLIVGMINSAVNQQGRGNLI
tara:strand:+ start:1887 stop:3653 length:1767 start_codon:yes stop_codon:yes gene_type:complete